MPDLVREANAVMIQHNQQAGDSSSVCWLATIVVHLMSITPNLMEPVQQARDGGSPDSLAPECRV